MHFNEFQAHVSRTMLQRRLISSEASAAWQSRITRQITPARNAELIDYQKKLKIVRQQYREELKDQPTKAQIEAARKAHNRETVLSKWNARMAETRAKVNNIVQESTAQNLTQKQHPCRPTVLHTKTAESRAVNSARLADPLRPSLVMRRNKLRDIMDFPRVFADLKGKILSTI